ncbi:pyridoxal phosphate-dependent transferase [Aspergillus californicus]
MATTRPSLNYLLTPNLSRPNPTILSARRNLLTLEDGRTIIDATGGPAVVSTGHGDEDVQRAVLGQMSQFSFAHSLFWGHNAAKELARVLIESTDGKLSKALFFGSGSEAIDAIMKLARQFYLELGQPGRTHFIAREGSFHGTTIGSLALTGKRGPRVQFQPILPQNVSFVSACNLYRGQRADEKTADYIQRLAQELEDEIQRVGPDKVTGFFVETVSGSSLGCVPPPPGYLAAIKEVCQRHGVFFILDEVICGMGRTGTYHAWQHENVVPDIQAVAKGLAGGYAPISGVLVSSQVVDVLASGSGFFNHGHTYQLHAVGCAAALEVQRMIKRDDLITNVEIRGRRLYEGLTRVVGDLPNFVKDKGSKEPFPAKDGVAFRLRAKGLEEPYFVSVHPGNGCADGVNGDLLLLSPAYNSTEEIDEIVDRVGRLVRDFFSE